MFTHYHCYRLTLRKMEAIAAPRCVSEEATARYLNIV